MTRLLNGYEHLNQLLMNGESTDIHSEIQKINDLRQKEDIKYILEDTANLLNESKDGLTRIQSIVSGLKRFSRVDDSGLKKILINDEIKNTLLLLQNELKYRCKVNLLLNATSEIECLPGEVSQVLMNLITNAAHAVTKGGGLITILSVDLEKAIQVKVKDNGCGIPPENLEKIFNPFFTTKPVGEGTGLGLAISHGIVKKHRGKLMVASEVGKGTEFTLELPIQANLQKEEGVA